MIKMDCAAFIILQYHQIDIEYGESEEMAPLILISKAWRKHVCGMCTSFYPTFIVKLELTGVYLFFLFLIQNIQSLSSWRF